MENDQADKSFAEHLRLVYKESIVDVSKGRVRVNLAQLHQVVLECAQERLVHAAFEFSYSLDDHELDEFTSNTAELLNQYGNVITIFSSNGLLSTWLTG